MRDLSAVSANRDDSGMTGSAKVPADATGGLHAHCSRIGFTEWPHRNQTPTKFRGYDFSGQNSKGVSMRIVTASVIIAALSLGGPAFAQTQGTPAQSATQPPQSSTVIRSIQVVDVKDLQPAVRSKVDDLVANTREEDIQSLRKSIDESPEAAAVLKAKGLSSSQIVAINIADGVLTMFAKTA
jgi:hypothetical protein